MSFANASSRLEIFFTAFFPENILEMIIAFLGKISAPTLDNIIEHNRTKYKIWIKITNSTYSVNGYI